MNPTATVRPTARTQIWPFAAPADGQHVVERHRHVGHDDLRERGAESHGFCATPVYCRSRPANAGAAGAGRRDLAVHFPAHPEQQNAAGERKTRRW